MPRRALLSLLLASAAALRHARPPGGGAPPPLSEKLRTRDSAVAERPAGAVVGGGAAWGVGAAFRFALPDEVLPSASAGDRAPPRLPTRGPPALAHVCVYQRVRRGVGIDE